MLCYFICSAQNTTEQNTKTGVRNRMETVQKEIMKISETRHNLRRFKAGIIFVLPVKATDSRPNNEIEKSVREHIGWPVDKDGGMGEVHSVILHLIESVSSK